MIDICDVEIIPGEFKATDATILPPKDRGFFIPSRTLTNEEITIILKSQCLLFNYPETYIEQGLDKSHFPNL